MDVIVLHQRDAVRSTLALPTNCDSDGTVTCCGIPVEYPLPVEPH